MTLSPVVAKWAADYEQEHICKPSELILCLVDHLLNVNDSFVELGKKDAQEGREPYPSDVFPGLVRNAFNCVLEESTVKNIADLWQSSYMNGYNSK